jgi:branched-subunit amino acid ABC-type transport system permease component
MADFIQLLVAGSATGGIYALVAIGFTLLLGRPRRRSTSRRASS